MTGNVATSSAMSQVPRSRLAATTTVPANETRNRIASTGSRVPSVAARARARGQARSTTTRAAIPAPNWRALVSESACEKQVWGNPSTPGCTVPEPTASPVGWTHNVACASPGPWARLGIVAAEAPRTASTAMTYGSCRKLGRTRSAMRTRTAPPIGMSAGRRVP